ncbi:biliverdin-producing heme oxygenase [Falsirhodobacter deserti]|uniref:biliverdin-producing heme oxygenase n=1 Tax=Falsirhodobacter deserti TaxID=1365611 RepID=UPI000FE43FE3|nr:biliverdin-producing heme oxygenase [Falsirhodobacter deserti]
MRDTTAAAHRALDAAVNGFADRAEYEAYVKANYRFRAAVEPSLGDVSFQGWRPRRILPALCRDMADLGLPCPKVPPLPPLAGSAMLGRLYVLEGAALGSQILRRQARAMGFDEIFGARHLAGDVTNWTAFLSLLDSAHPYDAGAAANGADVTFAAARTAFTKDPT